MALRVTRVARSSFMETASAWLIKTSGYREYGLKAEDLIREEAPGVTEALRRMPQEYLDERFFRLKRAMNLELKYATLPKEQWTTEAEDTKELCGVIRTVR